MDWAFFGGPRKWDPWECATPTYLGHDVRFPLPLSRDEFHRWEGIGTAKRYAALFPGEIQLGSLLVSHNQPFGTTGTATFGSSFFFPASPVTLAGTVSTIPYAHLGPKGTDVTFEFPLGVGTIVLHDRP